MLRAVACVALMCAGPALAHVTANPSEGAPGAFQRYAIRVPSEKPVPTVKVEVEFPQGLRVRETEALAGWRTTARKNDKGDIASVVWEGGSIPPEQFVEFGVIARNPDAPGELAWKAIQTYKDGSEVHWNGPHGAQFPASITRVRAPGDGGNERILEWAALAIALAGLVVAVLAWRRASKP